MLYDVLPPLLFFGSLGGVILVVSRVVARVRHAQFSQEVQAAGQQEPAQERLLGSSGRGISLVKNRLALIARTARGGIGQAREMVRLRRGKVMSGSAKDTRIVSVRPPASLWRNRLGVLSKGSLRRIMTLREKISHIQDSLPQPRTTTRAQASPQAEPAKTDEIKPRAEASRRPTVRLVTSSRQLAATGPEGQPSDRNISADTAAALSAGHRARLLRQLLKKERSLSAPLKLAAEAVSQARYDEAEDILVPYISRHARDAKAYMLLGQAVAGKGAWDEAVEIFGQVVKINSQEEGAQAALGKAALRAGKITLALASLQRARDNAPNDKKILKLLLTIAQRTDNQALKKSVHDQLAEIERDRALER